MPAIIYLLSVVVAIKSSLFFIEDSVHTYVSRNIEPVVKAIYAGNDQLEGFRDEKQNVIKKNYYIVVYPNIHHKTT